MKTEVKIREEIFTLSVSNKIIFITKPGGAQNFKSEDLFNHIKKLSFVEESVDDYTKNPNLKIVIKNKVKFSVNLEKRITSDAFEKELNEKFNKIKEHAENF
jgi:hypothetical protein